MRKYFCDRCGTEIDFESLDKYRRSTDVLYDTCVDAWTHGETGYHYHSPVELCTDCKRDLDIVVTEFMKEKSCSD